MFRNRWCGAYWASRGIRVIPSVNWGDEATFDFCFDGIEQGSVVAVSTYMASEHGNRKDQKEWFLKGYKEMLMRIKPEKIICYNTPFPEMEGDIVYVDYELSSWKYMSYERKSGNEDLGAYKISGYEPSQYDTMTSYWIIAGGGSAYGGDWQPSKNEDYRLVGSPGDINRSGDKITHIGNGGKADRERHSTDHGASDRHTNPHDHDISWEGNHPNFGPPINYYGDVPEFKRFERSHYNMNDKLIKKNSLEQNRFETISDFKWCMEQGGEVEFAWKGKHYGAIRYGANNKITIYEAFKPETEKSFETADEALEYIVNGDRLHDVITQVIVIDRTI